MYRCFFLSKLSLNYDGHLETRRRIDRLQALQLLFGGLSDESRRLNVRGIPWPARDRFGYFDHPRHRAGFS